MSGDPTNAGFDALIERVDPVGLVELNRDAALQTRTDRKYILTSDQAQLLVKSVVGSSSVLDIDGRRSFAYSTIYHDTADRQLYLDTARQRPKRFKVRIREYVDSGLAVLEVKTKNGRRRTVKHRLDLATLGEVAPSPSTPLTAEMRAFVDASVETDLTELLRPSLQVEFDRTTLLGTDGTERCTIDRGVRSQNLDGDVIAPSIVVVETKSKGRASSIDRWLWGQGCRPARLSKYCTSMAALDASLPSNRWNRTLARHF